MMPPLDLLTESPARKTIDISVVEDMRQRIIDGFKKNKVEVSEMSVIAGPTVVRFEFTSNQSYKIKQIRSCENTLNEVLSEYGPIRIIAPVSGKGTFAVEVPRPDRQIVRLREVLESDEFQKSKAKLPIALGISSENKPIVEDLFWMQDLLIGGGNTGKSMLLHNIISSLMYVKRPDELKFVFIDIKGHEFSVYSNLQFSYLATFDGKPTIITHAETILDILDSLRLESERRWRIQHEAGMPFRYNDLEQPSIIVVIENLTQLIDIFGDELKMRLYRLIGYGKSSGIHFVCTAQRPLPQMLNRTFQAYMSLKTYNTKDSQTIIGRSGAECLIDNGDMILYWDETDRFCEGHLEHFERIQGCYIGLNELQKVCAFIESPKTYILPKPDSDAKTSAEVDNNEDALFEKSDPLLEEAARYIIECGMASISKLQRRFSISYNRACRLLDQLEDDGIVGPKNRKGQRKVLKKGDSNDKHESSKSLFKRLLNLLNSEDDDDLGDDQTGKTEQLIVMDKERVKVDTPQCKDDLYDVSIPQSIFPYENYQIVGDTTEIDKVIQTAGIINIGVADITSTLSTDTLNYVTVGVGGNIEDALKLSVDNLPITPIQVGKMLFQILIPKDYKPDISEMKSMTDFIGKYNKDTDVCWGLAFDESLTDSIKVILIASRK